MDLLHSTITLWLPHYGYPALFALLMVGILGLPVPDEILLTFAGYLVFKGTFHWLPTQVTALLGSACGITVSYGLGRSLGVGVVRRYGKWLHVTPARLDRAQAWFDRLGKWVLTFGYFIPGVRHFTAIVAGTSKLRWSTFAAHAYLGALIWSATFIAVGYFVGDAWAQTSMRVHQYVLYGGAVVIALVAVFLAIRYLARRRAG